VKRILVFAALASACSRPQPSGPLRTAILRFDDQTGDPSLAYAAHAASQLLAGQLSSGKRILAVAADGADPSGQRALAIATGVPRILHGYVGLTGGRLRLRVQLEDGAGGGMLESAEASGAREAGVLPLAAAVARSLDISAGPAFTRSEKALESYIEAMDARSADPALVAIERAVAADPYFGQAYLRWLRLALARQDRELAARVVSLARARGNAIHEADRARLEAEAAALANDRGAQVKALSDLARATPGDPSALRAAADAHAHARNFTAAAALYEKAAALQPADLLLWNTLGYTYGLAGDLDGATRALRRYEALRPKDGNPLDSLGEVHFYNGRFAEAAALFRQAYEREPAFNGGAAQAKAGLSRWMSGDQAGAAKEIEAYLSRLRAAKDPLAAYRQAEWEYSTGDPKAALGKMTAFAAQSAKTGQREAAILGYRAAALWQLDQGNRRPALESSAAALRLAQGTNLAPAAGLAAFASNPSAPAAEWASRAQRAFSDPRLDSFKAAMLGYALLFDGHPAEALEPLRRSADMEPPGPSATTPFLIAWAAADSGQTALAAGTLRFTPILPFYAPSPVTPILLRRLQSLRAKIQ
jgi:Flp pilus assembly protein TadD